MRLNQQTYTKNEPGSNIKILANVHIIFIKVKYLRCRGVCVRKKTNFSLPIKKSIYLKQKLSVANFSVGTVDRNLSAKAGNMGSTPDPVRFQAPQSN